MGWRRNRKKQRQKDRRYKSRRPDRAERITAFKAVDQARPGPLMASRAAHVGPGTPNTAPGAQTVESRNGATGSAIPPPQGQGVQGDSGIGQPQTALFESRGGTRGDTNLVTRAIKKRWETDKRMSEAILTKIGLKALQDEKLTMPQLLGAGKLMLDVERQNQAEEHHVERMDYAERALQMRAKVGQYKPPVAGATVETAGPAKISIYLPENNRQADDLDADIDAVIDMPLREEMAGEQ